MEQKIKQDNNRNIGKNIRQNKINTPHSDAEEAYLWYSEKVQNNEIPQPKYLNTLGECYFYGQGTSVNYDSAFSYFQQAAEAEYCNAQYNLGVAIAMATEPTLMTKKL